MWRLGLCVFALSFNSIFEPKNSEIICLHVTVRLIIGIVLHVDNLMTKIAAIWRSCIHCSVRNVLTLQPPNRIQSCFVSRSNHQFAADTSPLTSTTTTAAHPIMMVVHVITLWKVTTTFVRENFAVTIMSFGGSDFTVIFTAIYLAALQNCACCFVIVS